MNDPTGSGGIPPGLTPIPELGPRPYYAGPGGPGPVTSTVPDPDAAAPPAEAEAIQAEPAAQLAAAAADAQAAAAGWLTMYDRAKACGTPGQPAPPKTDVVLIYAGGLTPDPWTREDIAAQTARYRLPCWVARGTGSEAGTAEAHEFLAWLKEHKAPRRRLLVLDLETRGSGPDHDYEQAFRRTVAAAGYWLALYGSTGNLFSYAATGGGYFVADPPGPGQVARPHMYDHPHAAITQWRFAIPGEDWDLSVLRAEVRALLWDTEWLRPALVEAHHVRDEADRLVRLLTDYAGG